MQPTKHHLRRADPQLLRRLNDLWDLEALLHLRIGAEGRVRLEEDVVRLGPGEQLGLGVEPV